MTATSSASNFSSAECSSLNSPNRANEPAEPIAQQKRSKVKTFFLALVGIVCVVATVFFALLAVAMIAGAIIAAVNGGGAGAITIGALAAGIFVGLSVAGGCLAYLYFKKI